jgi:hypothetical protein
MPKLALTYRTQKIRDTVAKSLSASLPGGAAMKEYEVVEGADPETPGGAFLLVLLDIPLADLFALNTKIRAVEKDNGNPRLGNSKLVQKCLEHGDFASLQEKTFERNFPAPLKVEVDASEPTPPPRWPFMVDVRG